MRLWCRETGEIKLVPCRRLGCDVCLKRAAWRRAVGIGEAAPDRWMTLTLVGDSWELVRHRLKRFRFNVVRELGVDFEMTYCVEPNPKGTGHHAHVWQRGRHFLDWDGLNRVTAREGMGHVRRLQEWRAGGEGYGLKGATGYGLKSVEMSESAAVYLQVNGGRLTHQSRGFFDGGVRAAEARGVARLRQAGDAVTWELVKVSELHNARS